MVLLTGNESNSVIQIGRHCPRVLSLVSPSPEAEQLKHSRSDLCQSRLVSEYGLLSEDQGHQLF